MSERLHEADSAVIFIPAGVDGRVTSDRGLGVDMAFSEPEKDWRMNANWTPWVVLHGDIGAADVARLVLGGARESEGGEIGLIGARFTLEPFSILGTGSVDLIAWFDIDRAGRAFNPIATGLMPDNGDDDALFGHVAITRAVSVGEGRKADGVEVGTGADLIGVNLGIPAMDMLSVVGHLLVSAMALQAVGVQVRDELIADEVTRGLKGIEDLLGGGER